MDLAYSYSGYTKLISPSWLDGTAMRDVGYRTVARYRRRWFGTVAEACPLMPPQYRERFRFDD